MKTVTENEARNIVENYNSGRIFTVTFVKRTTGETRVMNCRKGVVKGTTGTGKRYDPAQKGLACVYDMKLGKFRSIDLESIQKVSMGHEVYEVK